MFDLIIARLKEEAPALPDVEFAEDLDVVAKSVQRRSGTTFVIPYRGQGSPNRLATGFRQLITVQFIVAVILRYHSDALGKARADKFDALENEILEALAGWEPTPSSEPCELVAFESTALGNSVTVYAQTWKTTRLLTAKD